MLSYTGEKSKIRVSGILPIYNGERWILNNLPSILHSLRSFDELIIIDDGSIDKSLEMISDCAKRDSRVKVFKSQHNGLVSALNFGISQAKNEWIARFDIDDSYSKDRIINQVLAIERTQDIGAVFADYQILQNGERDRGRIYSPIFPIQTKLSLINSQRTAHPVALLNRSLVIKSGGYIEDQYPSEDIGLWIRLSQFSKLISTSHVGLQYNRHSSSISSNFRSLSKSRKVQLSRTLAFSVEEENRLMNEFGNLFHEYDDLENSNVRKYLFVFDYLTWILRKESNLTMRQSVKLIFGTVLPLLSTLTDAEVWGLNYRALQRKLERLYGYSIGKISKYSRTV